jgi:putative transposase
MRERKHNRLDGFDYASAGFYFVTVCTKNRENVFGAIKNGTMEENASGRIVRRCWSDLPRHYPHCRLHEFVVMPNHIHGVIEIVESDNVGTGFKPVPTNGPTIDTNKPMSHRHSLSEIIRGFKTFSSRAINGGTPDGFFRWQRSFYDRVIRDDRELAAIREYIVENPRHWPDDKENKGIGTELL